MLKDYRGETLGLRGDLSQARQAAAQSAGAPSLALTFPAVKDSLAPVKEGSLAGHLPLPPSLFSSMPLNNVNLNL